MAKKNQLLPSSSPESFRNKESWGDGPWLNEPGMDEEVIFEYKGYECVLRRNDFGAWCGYVIVPIDSKWAKYEHPMDIPLRIHGGITYGEEGAIRESGKPVYVIGFDCSHLNDYSPLTAASEKLFDQIWIHSNPDIQERIKAYRERVAEFNKSSMWKKVYRTLEYARNELKGLVDQMEENNEK